MDEVADALVRYTLTGKDFVFRALVKVRELLRGVVSSAEQRAVGKRVGEVSHGGNLLRGSRLEDSGELGGRRETAHHHLLLRVDERVQVQELEEEDEFRLGGLLHGDQSSHKTTEVRIRCTQVVLTKTSAAERTWAILTAASTARACFFSYAALTRC